jgi:hypothetical protein
MICAFRLQKYEELSELPNVFGKKWGLDNAQKIAEDSHLPLFRSKEI